MESQQAGELSRWYESTLRVRYQESDQMGVVYHANYLNWFESGRTEMFRQLGFSYRELENRGALLPVTSADLQFKSPARYDDIISVYARMTIFSALRVVFEYQVRRLSEEEGRNSEGCASTLEQLRSNDLPGELLVTGSTNHVWVNREWKPARLDRTLPELFSAIKGALREEGSSV